jgi:hypothetical protein
MANVRKMKGGGPMESKGDGGKRNIMMDMLGVQKGSGSKGFITGLFKTLRPNSASFRSAESPENPGQAGMVKRYAKGGKVGRGDGCCMKGKTKGAMR